MRNDKRHIDKIHDIKVHFLPLNNLPECGHFGIPCMGQKLGNAIRGMGTFVSSRRRIVWAYRLLVGWTKTGQTTRTWLMTMTNSVK
jgi:hypothetical protein